MKFFIVRKKLMFLNLTRWKNFSIKTINKITSIIIMNYFVKFMMINDIFSNNDWFHNVYHNVYHNIVDKKNLYSSIWWKLMISWKNISISIHDSLEILFCAVFLQMIQFVFLNNLKIVESILAPMCSVELNF
jgi:hypothetical protein